MASLLLEGDNWGDARLLLPALQGSSSTILRLSDSQRAQSPLLVKKDTSGLKPHWVPRRMRMITQIHRGKTSKCRSLHSTPAWPHAKLPSHTLQAARQRRLPGMTSKGRLLHSMPAQLHAKLPSHTLQTARQRQLPGKPPRTRPTWTIVPRHSPTMMTTWPR